MPSKKDLLELLLDELPPEVYADSGDVVDLGSGPIPKELHKRSLDAKALLLFEAEEERLDVVQDSHAITFEGFVAAWEEMVLGRLHAGDVFEARRDRVVRHLRNRPNLTEAYIRKRAAEILGYEPLIKPFTEEVWSLGESELEVDTILGSQVQAYIYLVKLAETVDADTLARLDALLTAIEPARSTHVIDNLDPEVDNWLLDVGALGTTTDLN